MVKTIMIVNGEAEIREAVKTVMEKEGYRVVVAVNGDDALKKAESANPDLILMEIMLPGTPVKDIVPKLKNKIVYLSVVRASGDDLKDLMKPKNVVDFIKTPFDEKDLIKRVKMLVD